MKPANQILLIRVTGDRAEERVDLVAAEIACTLVVNNRELVSLLCTPTELEALTLGFLLSEGLLEERNSLPAMGVDEEKSVVRVELPDLPTDWQDRFHKKTVTSGCGKGITFTDPGSLTSLPADRKPIHLTTGRIQDFLADFRNRSQLFISTGGVHSAALADSTKILLFAEDIGRHNAVDKLIGKAFLQEIPLRDKILISSGRISAEIMTKVVRNKIPVLISRTAPTCMAVTHAEDHGVTLIGFARGNRMNIYTHPLGVVLDNLTGDDNEEIV
ncbi:MAG: formate dehydrogenase accessory sulfurtransferase FdhD [Desulfobacterales bacterium]|nr:formate dehydrogenase accessory sulfurtransferase FdhD [Desulfobacterales bacterium]